MSIQCSECNTGESSKLNSRAQNLFFFFSLHTSVQPNENMLIFCLNTQSEEFQTLNYATIVYY